MLTNSKEEKPVLASGVTNAIGLVINPANPLSQSNGGSNTSTGYGANQVIVQNTSNNAFTSGSGLTFSGGANPGILTVTGPGSSTDCTKSIAFFESSSSPNTGNVYGIATGRQGRDFLMMGINADTSPALYQVPAGSDFISSFSSASNISIGRGNGSGLPDKMDIQIDGSGNVSMANGSTYLGISSTSSSQNFQAPHLLNLYGADGSSANALSFYTTADGYPGLNLFFYTRDSQGINFDSYLSGAGASAHFYSAYATSNYQITHTAQQLQFNYASGFAQGSVITWSSGFYLDTSGHVNIHGLSASSPVFTDSSNNLSSSGVVPIANGGTNTSVTPVMAGIIYFDGVEYNSTSYFLYNGTNEFQLNGSFSAISANLNNTLSGAAGATFYIGRADNSGSASTTYQQDFVQQWEVGLKPGDTSLHFYDWSTRLDRMVLDQSGNLKINGLTASELTATNSSQQLVSGNLSGDVTSVQFATTISTNAVTNSKFRQSGPTSLVGNATASTANVADITATADNQVMRRSGGLLAFGSIDISQSNTVGTSILGQANGGTNTNASAYGANQIIFQNTSNTAFTSSLSLTYNNYSLVLSGAGSTPNGSTGQIIQTTTIGNLNQAFMRLKRGDEANGNASYYWATGGTDLWGLGVAANFNDISFFNFGSSSNVLTLGYANNNIQANVGSFLTNQAFGFTNFITGSPPVGVCIAAPAAQTLGFYTNSALQGEFDSSGNFSVLNGNLTVTGPGSSTTAQPNLGYFTSVSPATDSNIYSIGINKSGHNSLLLGVNKNSSTGNIPSEAVFISTFVTNSTLTIGRGGGNGNPAYPDIQVIGNASTGFANIIMNDNTITPSTTSSLQNPSLLNLYGTDSTVNNGISFYTTADSNPGLNLYNFRHGNQAINFDAYSNGTNFTSSSATSNYQIIHNGLLEFNYASGVAVGGTFNFSTACSIDTSGNFFPWNSVIFATASGYLSFPHIAVSSGTADGILVTGVVPSAGIVTIINTKVTSSFYGFPFIITRGGTPGVASVSCGSGTATLTTTSADTSTYGILFFQAQ